jgi:hypothetical protein
MASQQLSGPVFNRPEELVAWMGAIQAQDYAACKWAVGARLQPPASVRSIEKALETGEILRTHVMRPTWHLVAAGDIRWMLKLSAPHIKTAARPGDRMLEITEHLYTRINGLMEKMLEGNRSLTRREIALELSREGITVDSARMNHFLMRAEIEGIICSGVDRDNKPAYALLEERAAPAKPLHREEALAGLAENYFRSHSPASLRDFVWWSGLSVAEARQAVRLIEDRLTAVRFGEQALWVHQSCREAAMDEALHLLPSYDEYIISYKDRSSVLNPEHYPETFTRQGRFHPIILYRGAIVGTWKKSLRKNLPVISPAFFEKPPVCEESLRAAISKYRQFLRCV